jgi:hypothetical protein
VNLIDHRLVKQSGLKIEVKKKIIHKALRDLFLQNIHQKVATHYDSAFLSFYFFCLEDKHM